MFNEEKKNYIPLQSIGGIRFTCREIDIISCLLSGRTAKTIGCFLFISPKTVESNIYNIMAKLGCNSKEAIINFIESSGKFGLIKNHYISMKIKNIYEQKIREISSIVSKKKLYCLILYQSKNKYLAINLINFLEKVGIHTRSYLANEITDLSDFINSQKSDIINCCIFIDCNFKKLFFYDDKNKIQSEIIKDIFRRTIYVYLENIENIKEVFFNNSISIIFKNNFYLFSFKIIQGIVEDIKIDNIINEFKNQFNYIKNNEQENSSYDEKYVIKKLLENKFIKKYKILILFNLSLIISCIFIFFIKSNFTESKNNEYINYITSLPNKKFFLNRQFLISQIEKKINGKKGIQVLALIGIGGSGKTTLARQYVLANQSCFSWEINAENKDNVISSFKKLAYILAITKEDKNILQGIQFIKSSREREIKFLCFVRQRLKLKPYWILIYDNVDNFSEIKKYLPYNSELWGNGRVIITSKNSNISSIGYVNNLIEINELNNSEKLKLFINILKSNNNKGIEKFEYKKYYNFLQQIPPFPLDVSIAAYYLKETGVSYNNYLSNLKNYNKYFSQMQEKILNELNSYKKTRYNIITLSLEKIIKKNKKFELLLLLISLLENNNIPRDILENFGSLVVVDDFIYNLKKYSLLTINTMSNFNEISKISIHKSTQEISLNYLKNTISLEKKKKYISLILEKLEKYAVRVMESGSNYLIENLVNHYKNLLNCSDLLTNNIKSNIEVELGGLYFNINDYFKSKYFIEKNINFIIKKKKYKTLIYLGNIYKEIGDYEKSEFIFKKTTSIYNKYYHQNPLNIAWNLAYLGNFYRCLGNYQLAKNTLEESLLIYQKTLPKNSVEIAWSMALLQYVYTDLGHYEKSNILLNKSLEIYKNISPNNHRRIGWILALMGNVYQEKGEYNKSKDLLEQSLIILKKEFSEDNLGIAWVFGFLGNVYTKLGYYEKAKFYLEKSLYIYQKKYLKNHTKISWINELLGNLYYEQKKYDIAKDLLEKSLDIYKKKFLKNHLSIARSLMRLGMIYKNIGLDEKSKYSMQQALDIYRNNLPENHEKIIQVKKAILEGGVCDKLPLSEK